MVVQAVHAPPPLCGAVARRIALMCRLLLGSCRPHGTHLLCASADQGLKHLSIALAHKQLAQLHCCCWPACSKGQG